VYGHAVESGQPSRTALGAAAHRAAHQVLERGAVFSDALALQILGDGGDELVARICAPPSSRRLRLFIAVRSRFADDALSAALARGAEQVVVLGAGLDTLAYRRTWPDHVRIYEVDHPATQEWKRRRLGETAIPVPAALTYAAVDFERDALGTGLERAGFDPRRATFLTWLGVVPYLTEPAIRQTLEWIARLPGGGEVVFDYANPPAGAEPTQRAADHDDLAERVSGIGEPFRSWFASQTLHETLRKLGFGAIEDLGPEEIRQRYFARAPRATGGGQGGHVVRAATSAG
jgi:methyltransferase (TIGR00027 family)